MTYSKFLKIMPAKYNIHAYSLNNKCLDKMPYDSLSDLAIAHVDFVNIGSDVNVTLCVTFRDEED